MAGQAGPPGQAGQPAVLNSNMYITIIIKLRFLPIADTLQVGHC